MNHLPSAPAPSPSVPRLPVLSPDTLQGIARDILVTITADTAAVMIDHTAIGMARVALGRVRMQDNGDRIQIVLVTQYGQRAQAWLAINQIDTATLRRAAAYLDRVARELPGDPMAIGMPIPPRHYLPNTTWQPATADAFLEARHAMLPALVGPVLDAGVTASAFVGVYAHSTAYMDKQGIAVAGEETDAEIALTGWTADGKGTGWAGQAARDWSTMDAASVAARAIELTRRSANPVAFEPGRHTVILDRPAVAQLVHAMGNAFDAESTMAGYTPLYNSITHQLRLGDRIMDPRVILSSDPNDPDGGCLPFNQHGMPIIPMTWVDHGVHTNLAFKTDFAASMGYAPANDPPSALRLQAASGHALLNVDEMIATCADGLYVNRFAYIQGAGSDPTVGTLTGVTAGGCFLIRNGKIDKPIKNLRFLDSPWQCFDRIQSIGHAARAAFGYAPWAGGWPVDPTIVPPLMIRDFNFTALADTA